MNPRDIVIEAVAAKRLRRHPQYRARASGEGLLLTAPFRQRPILRCQIPVVQRIVWEFFSEPHEVGQAVAHVRALRPDLTPWEALTAVVNLERRGALVPVLAEGAPGLPLVDR